MNQEWFEMADLRRKIYNKSVWIPLRANYPTKSGRYGYEGYKEDYFGNGSVAVPIKNIDDAKKLGWNDIGISHNHGGSFESGEYIQAGKYIDYQSGFEGDHLVLEQVLENGEPSIWYLNQDLVLALDLKQEGDSWLCPKDGYIEVARLIKSTNNKPLLLEIKAEYLKDYLCAREMVLYLTQFHSRDYISNNNTSINWENGNKQEVKEHESWEGRIIPIHEGGEHYGSKVAVFHASRTDIHETDDVPDISTFSTDENTTSSTWEKRFDGRKLYRIIGELWRNEIIEPAKLSPKVRDDKVVSTVYFILDADGSKVCGDDLIKSGKWLWFKPDVIMALSHRRGGFLSFYTQETGSVACTDVYGVHFGVNDLGLVNVYAKDVGMLPEWQQQIWAGFNITPEGGVSSELLASQVKADPANTQAPEPFLLSMIESINSHSMEKLGINIFRDHELIPELVTKAHRFRAVDQASFYALAKDLARIITDSLDANTMQTIVPPPKKTIWGSLKSLENLLSSQIERSLVREMTASLVGVYELRHADAHLPGGKIKEAFQLIQIDRNLPFVHQGRMMLHQVVTSLSGVAQVLENRENQ